MSCELLEGRAGSQVPLPAMGPAHPDGASKAFHKALSGLAVPASASTPAWDPSYCLPPPPPSPPPPQKKKHPKKHQPHVQGNPGQWESCGQYIGRRTGGDKPSSLQLPHVAGSDGFSASPPCPAGRVLSCARHMGQLWVSGPRLWEGAWASLVGFTGGGLLVPRGHPPGS